jgi:hypothetical protein
MGCRKGGRCPRSTGQEAERSRRRIAHCSGRGTCGHLMARPPLDCVLHLLHVRVREFACQDRASGSPAPSTERSPDVVSSSITCRIPRPGCGCVAGSGCSVAMRTPGHPVLDTSQLSAQDSTKRLFLFQAFRTNKERAQSASNQTPNCSAQMLPLRPRSSHPAASGWQSFP